MAERWQILALLFVVRTTMAFQFQSVGALGPLVRSSFGIGLPDLGLLIGLHMSPGLLLAIPAAAIGRRFGKKTCVLTGMALMVAGGLVMALVPGWPAQIGGRLLAGLLWGLPAGPIMGLPARLLPPETRTAGMGIFWTLFYLVVVTAPWIAGQISAALGTAQAAFGFGIGMLAATCLLYAVFLRLARTA